MRPMDKWLLWGAWTVMAVVGTLSIWRTSQTPKVDPAIMALKADIEAGWRKPATPIPQDPILRKRGGYEFGSVVAAPVPAKDWVAFILPEAVGKPVKHPPVDVFILPTPVTGTAKATLDGTTITWTLEHKKVPLQPWETQKEAVPTEFTIEREYNGRTDVLATLGPKDRSFMDLTAQPGQTYRYQVRLKGRETIPASYPAEDQMVTKVSETPSEARSPRATRLKLVGGDKDNALVRVETYDRTVKKWIGKLTPAVPGREIASSGWTLKGLRFDNFTLTADVSDADGVDSVLTTRN